MYKMVIIGNGFDRYHGLRTSYADYAQFLNTNNPELFTKFLEFYGFSDIPSDEECNSLWADFENDLAKLDGATVLEYYSDYIASSNSAEFRDRDWGAFAIEIEMFVTDLTDNIANSFKQFINHVIHLPEERLRVNKLHLSPEHQYLSFNYTNTLERYYQIPQQQIRYLHGKVMNSEDRLILGHGINPDNFLPKEEQQPIGLNEEEIERWQEYMNDKFDHSFDLGEQQLHSYYQSTFKHTAKIIADNADFFDNLTETNEVLVIGHSLEEPDLPYFQKIVDGTNTQTNWTVTYFDKADKDNHRHTLMGLGVADDRINIVQIKNLVEPSS